MRNSSSPPPPFGVVLETLGFSSGEPGIVGCQTLGPRAPPLRGSHQDLPLPLPRVVMPLIRGTCIFNPNEAGIGRTDHQIGPLEVAVTTGSTTTVVSTVSYHLISLSSDGVIW